MKTLLSAEQVALVEKLWAAGEPLDRVCHGAGISRDLLIERRRDQLAHLERRQRGVNSQATREPDPSPETIAERAAAIRAGWSEVEKLNRRAGPGWPVGSFEGERVGGRHVPSRINRRTW